MRLGEPGRQTWAIIKGAVSFVLAPMVGFAAMMLLRWLGASDWVAIIGFVVVMVAVEIIQDRRDAS